MSGWCPKIGERGGSVEDGQIFGADDISWNTALTHKDSDSLGGDRILVDAALGGAGVVEGIVEIVGID